MVEKPERCGDIWVYLDLNWGKARNCLEKSLQPTSIILKKVLRHVFRLHRNTLKMRAKISECHSMQAWAHPWDNRLQQMQIGLSKSQSCMGRSICVILHVSKVVEIPERCGGNCVHVNVSWGKVRQRLEKHELCNKLNYTISTNELTSPLSTLQDCTQVDSLQLNRADMSNILRSKLELTADWTAPLIPRDASRIRCVECLSPPLTHCCTDTKGGLSSSLPFTSYIK